MSSRKPKAWLVYEEGESYDGGMAPLFVASTETLAAQAKADIEQIVTGVRARLNRLPDMFEPGISDDEYRARHDRRERMLKRVRWPHGIKRDFWNWDFTVAVLPLPILQEPR